MSEMAEQKFQFDSEMFSEFCELLENSNVSSDVLDNFMQKHNVDINAMVDDRSLLSYAVDFGNVSVVEYLVEHGADLEVKDENGRNAFLMATFNYSVGFTDAKVVNFFLEKGVDANVQDNKGNSALNYAVMYGNNEALNYFLEKGLDTTTKDDEGATVLHYAVASGNKEMVDYLLEKGLDITAKNNDDVTMLHYAALGGNKEIFDCLVEKGLDIRAKDKDDMTMLHYAVLGGNKEIFDSLVETGADLTAENKKGERVSDMFKYTHGENVADLDEMISSVRHYVQAQQTGSFRSNVRKYASTVESSMEGNLGGGTSNAGDIHLTRYNSEVAAYHEQRLNGQENAKPDLEGYRGNPQMEIDTLVHEYQHWLHFVEDGWADTSLLGHEKVKGDYCSEAIAHTAQIMRAALSYQSLKQAGVEVFTYQDNMGNFREMPVDDLLKNYSPEILSYVKENGFDPNNQNSVDEMTALGVDYWLSRKDLYDGQGAQFDRSGSADFDGKMMFDTIMHSSENSAEYTALVERMCEGVCLGEGADKNGKRSDIRINLNNSKGLLDAMSNEEALFHCLRGNGLVSNKEEMETLTSLVKNFKESDCEIMNKYLYSQGNETQVSNKEEYMEKVFEICQNDKLLSEYVAYKKEAERSNLVQEISSQKGEIPELPIDMQERVDRMEKSLPTHQSESARENEPVEAEKTNDIDILKMYHDNGRG